MKKFARTASFVALLCLCCCFSTFVSVKASAYEFEYLSYPWMGNGTVYYGTKLSTVQDESYETTKNSLNVYTYEFTSTSALTVDKLFFGNDLYDFLYPYDLSRYTYKFVGAFVFDYKVGEFNPSSVMLEDIVIHQFSNGNLVSSDSVSNLVVDKKTNLDGVVFNFNFDLPIYNTMNVIELQFNPAGKYTDRDTSRIKITGSVVAIPKDTSAESANAIVKAIQDQTDDLNQAIDESTEDIQQSIEDQYGGDPSEEIDVDSIISDYEEKMGVLTFGTETTLHMLELFSPENAGEAYIRVPGWSMDIQGETYNVWNEYIFYFSSIEEWIPLLVRLMRTFNVTMFYIAILSYINKVYERNFLSK